MSCGVYAQNGVARNGIARGGIAAAGPEAQAAAAAPVVITLDEAIARAEKNAPAFANAVAASKSAAADRSIARSNLLPNVRYHNQYLYTESSGALGRASSGGNQDFIFIANNAIHEYASQAVVTETLGFAGIAGLKRADAAAAQAAAEQEVARRGLVFAVVQQYFGLLAAEKKLDVSRQAADEAGRFVDLTEKLEKGREVAHADVLKAELQLQQRQRDEENAQLLAENARLELGILLFTDPRTPYTLADGSQTPAVPDRATVDAAAEKNNPDVKAAMEALKAAKEDVSAARAGYLPDLSLNWTYGIDAPQFATYGPLDTTIAPVKPKNLGYSASATLDIPVWDWFATHAKVKQSVAKRAAAKVALTAAQKRLLAEMDEFYNEAMVAGKQLTSLDESVKDATESLRLTTLRYQAGEATVLEVVDAQTTLSQAEQAQADGVVRYRVALANLQTLTGTM
ncbi:MAG: TolC family protein [Acidobacteriaceae bacterium]